MKKNILNSLLVFIIFTGFTFLICFLTINLIHPPKTTVFQNDQIVYVFPGEKTFHQQYCVFAKNAKPINLEEAKKQGIKPCPMCKP